LIFLVNELHGYQETIQYQLREFNCSRVTQAVDPHECCPTDTLPPEETINAMKKLFASSAINWMNLPMKGLAKTRMAFGRRAYIYREIIKRSSTNTTGGMINAAVQMDSERTNLRLSLNQYINFLKGNDECVKKRGKIDS